MGDAGVHRGALFMVLAWACSTAMADEGPSPAVTRVANTTRAAQAGEAGARHLSLGSTLGELLRHPAFEGHARQLLPRDDVAINDTLPIARMGDLLKLTRSGHNVQRQRCEELGRCAAGTWPPGSWRTATRRR